MQIKTGKKYHYFRSVTPEVIQSILTDIEEGGTRKHAAEANGISRRHFHNLVAQGICDMENDIHDTLHVALVLSLRKIELKEIKECRKLIIKNKKSHKGAEWTLEHVYWRDFGSRAEVKELSEEIEQLREQLKGNKAHGKANSKSEK